VAAILRRVADPKNGTKRLYKGNIKENKLKNRFIYAGPLVYDSGASISRRHKNSENLSRLRRCMMRTIGIVMLLSASLCFAQGSSDFKPASSNVLDAQFPQVDGNSRVQIRFKAPDATKVRVNFWSGPKADMEKQADGFWTITTPQLAPGLHYYTIIVDGAEVSDPGSTAYFGGSKWASAVEVPEAGAD
jgi:hypothetical protein